MVANITVPRTGVFMMATMAGFIIVSLPGLIIIDDFMSRIIIAAIIQTLIIMIADSILMTDSAVCILVDRNMDMHIIIADKGENRRGKSAA